MGGVKLVLLLLLAMATAGCELAGNIFEAGVWVGVVLVVAVVAAIAFVISRIRS